MEKIILDILIKHNLTPSIELVEAMREVYKAGEAESDSGDDAHPGTETLSAADRTRIMALGIDPDKKFRIRNSVFTIVGYKPSRWKFPISACTQTGARYKFTIDQVKRNQM